MPDLMTGILQDVRYAMRSLAKTPAVANGSPCRRFGVLFGVSPHSPALLAVSTGLIVLVALIAAAIPARRAARVEPLVALRYE
jgi:ABC-type antimicrobial peptide transport system permease subunit